MRGHTHNTHVHTNDTHILQPSGAGENLELPTNKYSVFEGIECPSANYSHPQQMPPFPSFHTAPCNSCEQQSHQNLVQISVVNSGQ